MNAEKVFDWNDTTAVGNLGEQHFRIRYEVLNPIKSIQDRRFDFTITNTHNVKKKVEMKTARYYSNCGAMFLERWEDFNKTFHAGPWRYNEDKIDFFVYYYIRDNKFLWFRTKDLVIRLDEVLNKPYNKAYMMKVKNNGQSILNHPTEKWAVWGYVMPMEYVEDLVIM